MAASSPVEMTAICCDTLDEASTVAYTCGGCTKTPSAFAVAAVAKASAATQDTRNTSEAPDLISHLLQQFFGSGCSFRWTETDFLPSPRCCPGRVLHRRSV